MALPANLVLSAFLTPGLVILHVERTASQIAFTVSADETSSVPFLLHGGDGLLGGGNGLVTLAAGEPT